MQINFIVMFLKDFSKGLLKSVEAYFKYFLKQ